MQITSDIELSGAGCTTAITPNQLVQSSSVSFSEDNCTSQRGLKPVVYTAPESQISGLLCTKLVYAQYSC
ncbi:hypothetical protein, partial [Pseudomonas aeruginosa]|uniref:hypothetical protein n=1 Tax=Pseudomonas aeruginosa TaxID=287 RepID=UPI001C9A5E4D